MAEFYGFQSGLFNKFLCSWYKYHLHQLSWKLGYQIPMYTYGLGLRIHHWGPIIINGKAKIGQRAVIYPGVVIGQTDENSAPTIGDDVFIGLGAKVFGKVNIGNNVTIAPNAVVIRDIPSNAVVGGVPVHILKMKR